MQTHSSTYNFVGAGSQKQGSDCESKSGFFLFLSIIVRFITVIVLTLCSSVAIAETRVALVVGNSDYAGNAALKNPSNDAAAMAKMFEDIGFDEVLSAINTSRSGFEKALDNFHELASSADMAVFFYAGHAIQWQGGNYMIPVGVALESERDVKKLISLDDVVTDVSVAKSFGMVILDACRDNPFLVQLNGQGTRGFQRTGLASPSGALDTLVAFATQADAVAYDGVGDHSPFTAALLKHLPTPNKDISLVLRAVRDDVGTATDWKQQPFTYGSLRGQEIWMVEDKELLSVNGSSDQQDQNLNSIERREPPPGMAFFSVKPRPVDARVRILKPKTAYAPGMLLPLGQTYEIMVSRKGFRAARQSIRIDSTDVSVAVSLQAADGRTSRPAESSTPLSRVKIAVRVQESTNGARLKSAQPVSAKLSNALIADGVDVVSANELDVDSLLEMSFYYNVAHDEKFNTFSADCSAAYEIKRASDDRVLYSNQKSIQPSGGFTAEAVVADCRNRLVTSIKSPLIQSITTVSNTEDIDSMNLSVKVINARGGDVAGLISVIESIPNVVKAKADGFNSGTLTVLLKYRGGAFDFAQSMLEAGEQNGLPIQLDQVHEDNLVLALNR